MSRKLLILVLFFYLIDANNSLHAQNFWSFINGGGSAGSGTLFTMNSSSGVIIPQYNFDNNAFGTGYGPNSLLKAGNGMLYGTTGSGALLQINPLTHSIEKKQDLVLPNFTNPNPNVGSRTLTQAANGNIYGTTLSGGVNHGGTLYEYNIATNTLTTVYEFDTALAEVPGASPWGAPVEASNGKLYGMTEYGGLNDWGTLYEYDVATHSLTTKINFDRSTIGSEPIGVLIKASNGKLYGMTQSGGGNLDETHSYNGTLFEYDPINNTFSVLHRFTGAIDLFCNFEGTICYTEGDTPLGSLVQASNGKLYGFTLSGSRTTGVPSFLGGAIFEFDINTGNYAPKVYFPIGFYGYGSFSRSTNGNLYSIIQDPTCGEIIEYSPGSTSYTIKDVFNGSNGCTPQYFGEFVEVPDVCSPPVLNSISGPVSVCDIAGTPTTATYNINNISGNTYTWSSSTSNILIQGGQGTSSLTVLFKSTYTSGTLSVTVTNACGSASKSIMITKSKPSTPGAISGTANPCPFVGSGLPVTYSIRKIATADTYTWTVPSGVDIVGGASPFTTVDTAIQVIYAPSFTSGSISVIATNTCGTTVPRTLAITAKVPATPGTITGPMDICDAIGSNSDVTYSIRKVLNATSYEWIIPLGVTVISNTNDTSIVLRFPGTYNTGIISVRSVSGCGNSASYRNLTVTRKLPATPGAIVVTAGDICSSVFTGNTTVTYTIPANTTAPLPTSYEWTLTPVITGSAIITNGSGIIGSPSVTNIETTGLSIEVQFYGNYTTGTLSVKAKRSCGTSTKARTLTLKKNLPPTPAVPIATGTPCIGSLSSITYTISPATLNTDVYIWSSPSGTKIIGSNINAPTRDTTASNSITVNYPVTFVSGNITVKVRSACGTSAVTTLPVTAVSCNSSNRSAFTIAGNFQSSMESKAEIFPNPNQGECILRIQSPDNIIDDAKIQVINMYGQVVSVLFAANNNGLINVPISETKLANGIYTIKYQIGSKTNSIKMVIRK